MDNPERTALRLFKIVETESGKQIAETIFLDRVSINIQRLIDKYGVEKVLEDGLTEFKPICTLNDPLQIRMCWFNTVLFNILTWLNPDDAYSAAMAQDSEEAGNTAASKATHKVKQVKKRRRYYRYVQ